MSVRHAVVAALGLIDNEAVAVPVLIQLLTRGEKKDSARGRPRADRPLLALLASLVAAMGRPAAS